MAVGATTGPSPGLRVCTWVSVTLNGASTLTTGAAESVDPVTETLPVAPVSVHSGAPAVCGATDGHERAAVAMVDSATEDVATSATDGELDDDGERGEAELTAALDDLGRAVHRDQLFHQVVSALGFFHSRHT